VTFLDKNELRARQTETNASIISIFLIYTRTKTFASRGASLPFVSVYMD